jgi:hypothetical protein
MVYKKFESIKLNIIKGRELKAFPTARVLQDHEDRLKALESANANSGNTGTESNTGGSGTSGDSGNTGSSSQQEQTPTTRTLSFTINDGTDAIEGATVTIGAKTGTTGSAGGCTISDVEDGSQTVEVSATGYTTKTETISVDETHTSFTISLTVIPVYDVTLTVTDGTNAIEGATVVIGETTKTTDSNGECTFDDLEADTYSAEISKEGYTAKTESITVTSDDTSFTIAL